MPDRQASLVAQAPPLPSKRTRFKSESDVIHKQNLQLTPKSMSLSKLRKVRKTPRPLPSNIVNDHRECLLTRSSVTKTLVFATTNIETIPIGKLNNSEPFPEVDVKAKNIQQQPQQTLCTDVDEPILTTFNVAIRNPVDNILEEEQTVSTPNLNFRLHSESDILSSSYNMVSPSKLNISKPSMCHDQNGVEQKASPLVPQKRNNKRKQKEAQQGLRLTRASSLFVPETESFEKEKSFLVSPVTSNVLQKTTDPQSPLGLNSELSNSPHISIPSRKLDVTALTTVIQRKNSLLSSKLPCKKGESGSEDEISPPSTPSSLGFDTKTFYSSHKFNSSHKEVLLDCNNGCNELLENGYNTRLLEDLPLYKPEIKFEKDLIPLSKSLPSKPTCDKVSISPSKNDFDKQQHSEKAPDLINRHVEYTAGRTQVVNYSKTVGQKKCAAKFNIPLNTVREMIKEHNLLKKQSKNVSKSNMNMKKNGLHQTKVESKEIKPKALSRKCQQIQKKSAPLKLTKLKDKKSVFGKEPNLNENNQEIQSLVPKYEHGIHKKDNIELDLDDEWCNILEICDPCTDDDESRMENKSVKIDPWDQEINDNDAKSDESSLSKKRSQENPMKSDVKKCGTNQKMNIVSEERLNSEKVFSKKPFKKIIKRQKGSNSARRKLINKDSEIVHNSAATFVLEKPSKFSKWPLKIKEKWQSSKALLNSIKPVVPETNGELDEQKIQVKSIEPALNSKEDPILDGSCNIGLKEKPKRGRPRKKRATNESMNATIEAVVENSLLKYEANLIDAISEPCIDLAIVSKSETCKEIDLADLPLSQVHKLRKELKRSIFLQQKKEKYKEIFKKKKMNGTLKLKARNTRLVMAKSFKKWKEFKLKKQRDQTENDVRLITGNQKNEGMDKQVKKKKIKKLKPQVVTLEEQLASKPSPDHMHHILLNQQSYNYYDSDIARPSRPIVRPVRYLDFMKNNADNLTILRLPQDEDKSMPSYNTEALDWNEDHSVNSQGIYCYCGGSGSWHNKMVRCSRCDQWFHERCLAPRPFSMPIISGDSFWLFVCSMCNIGSECLKRMDLTWINLVHLAIFDLTSKTNRKFHDFDNDLMPFLLKNWAFFQLYKHFNCLTDSEKTLKTKETLLDESKTFEQGTETGQQDGLWGLRLLSPPHRPNYKVPNIGIISERTVLAEASISSIIHSDPDFFLNTSDNLNIIYNDYVKPVVPEKPKKSKIKKKLTVKTANKKSTQNISCPSQLISHKNIQKSLKNKSCKVKFKCLKLPEELKELLTENYESKVEDKKPLPYEISKTLHEKGYPKVAMKFATIIPPKKEVVVQALKADHQKSKKKRGPKSKKTLDNHIHHENHTEEKESSSDTSESSLLDALIPVKLDYCGENNPFKLGSFEEQRAARNLICNRKLKEEDLTKCRSRIRKRKHHLFIEESRKLWKSDELVLEKMRTEEQKKSTAGACNQDLQYAGKYTTPSGEIKFLLLNPENWTEDESQILDSA